jgi:beta-lactamase regulating signal transducer with metallopeptidase domain
MTVPGFHDWLFGSFAIGVIGVAFVSLCPAGWRVRVRQAVPVVAFVLLVALSIGFLRPLPRVELRAPAVLGHWTAAMEGWVTTWLVWTFVVGAMLFLARMIAGWFVVWRIVDRSRPAPGREWKALLAECRNTLGLRRNVRLLLAGPDFVPSATGLFRRTVLLPDEALNWTREQRRLVLLHELGHFRRGDLWTHAIGQLACALHWFNPFVWMLHRQLALEREFACDALVVSCGAPPADYATLLWKMGVAACGPRLAAAAFLAMAAPGRGKLEQRVQRILAPAREAGLWLRIADSAFCGVSALLLILCASLKPVVVRSFLGVSPWTTQEVEARLAADPFPGEK